MCQVSSSRNQPLSADVMIQQRVASPIAAGTTGACVRPSTLPTEASSVKLISIHPYEVQ